MNKIDFFCVFCGATLSAKESPVDNVLPCPKCSRQTPIPPLPGRQSLQWAEVYPPDIVAIDVIFHCPKCDARLGSDARTAGTQVYCPPCGTQVRVPHLEHLIRPRKSGAASKPASAQASAKLTADEIHFLNNVTQSTVPAASRIPAHASQ